MLNHLQEARLLHSCHAMLMPGERHAQRPQDEHREPAVRRSVKFDAQLIVAGSSAWLTV
jgi:hypothetical protein